MAIRRLRKELEQLSKTEHEISGCLINDNWYKWQLCILGPKGSPYEGGVYYLSIEFPNTYPFSPPSVQFITPIYHSNIKSHLDNGGCGCKYCKTNSICLGILRDDWSPAFTTERVLLTILELLACPFSNDGGDWGARMYERQQLILKDRELYLMNAADHCRVYADGFGAEKLKLISKKIENQFIHSLLVIRKILPKMYKHLGIRHTIAKYLYFTTNVDALRVGNGSAPLLKAPMHPSSVGKYISPSELWMGKSTSIKTFEKETKETMEVAKEVVKETVKEVVEGHGE